MFGERRSLELLLILPSHLSRANIRPCPAFGGLRMKSVVAFFLACLMLLGSLIPQNDLAELSKLPSLLEHYRFHHSAEGGGLSLTAFLIEHYGAGTRHLHGCTLSQRHHQDHHNLPLHNCHGNCPSGVFVLAAGRLVLPVAQPAPLVGLVYRPVAALPCPMGLAGALLEPPRA
jgi:hypothetical protein